MHPYTQIYTKITFQHILFQNLQNTFHVSNPNMLLSKAGKTQLFGGLDFATLYSQSVFPIGPVWGPVRPTQKHVQTDTAAMSDSFTKKLPKPSTAFRPEYML